MSLCIGSDWELLLPTTAARVGSDQDSKGQSSQDSTTQLTAKQLATSKGHCLGTPGCLKSTCVPSHLVLGAPVVPARLGLETGNLKTNCLPTSVNY